MYCLKLVSRQWTGLEVKAAISFVFRNNCSEGKASISYVSRKVAAIAMSPFCDILTDKDNKGKVKNTLTDKKFNNYVMIQEK